MSARVPISELQAMVARAFGVDPEHLCARHRRTHRRTLARQVAMYLAADLRTDMTAAAIGRLFARDRSTVVHAQLVVAERMQRDLRFRQRVDRLREELRQAAVSDAAFDETFAALVARARERALVDPARFLAAVAHGAELRLVFNDASKGD